MCPQFKRYLLLCCYTRRRRKKFTSLFIPKKTKKKQKKKKKNCWGARVFCVYFGDPKPVAIYSKTKKRQKNLHNFYYFFEHLSTARLKVMTTRTIISLCVYVCVNVQSYFFVVVLLAIIRQSKEKVLLKAEKQHVVVCVCTCVCMYL